MNHQFSLPWRNWQVTARTTEYVTVRRAILSGRGPCYETAGIPHSPLKFNRFSEDGIDEPYESVLRRGLEQSRREKGNDHEETLAHLAALAAHFERMDQPEAARPFAEEHARLTALIAQRKKAGQ